MRKVIVIVAIFFGLKYGISYLFSNDFEKYADREKLPWTCRFENVVAQVHLIMSEYEKAYFRFSHAVNRCPETGIAEEAEFGVARSLEGMGRRAEAVVYYRVFSEKYPGTKRARITNKAADVLKS